MKSFNVVAWYGITVGISMIGMWGMLLVTGQVPEFATRPVEISLHIVAEYLTGLLLIIGGIGLNKNLQWGLDVYLFALGMLMYTIIVSPGYYIQLGVHEFGILFAILILLTISCLVIVFKEKYSKYSAIGRKDDQL